jgi:hypothetical protein
MTGRGTAGFERLDPSQTVARAEPARPGSGTGKRRRGGPRRAVLRP